MRTRAEKAPEMVAPESGSYLWSDSTLDGASIRDGILRELIECLWQRIPMSGDPGIYCIPTATVAHFASLFFRSCDDAQYCGLRKASIELRRFEVDHSSLSAGRPRPRQSRPQALLGKAWPGPTSSAVAACRGPYEYLGRSWFVAQTMTERVRSSGAMSSRGPSIASTDAAAFAGRALKNSRHSASGSAVTTASGRSSDPV